MRSRLLLCTGVLAAFVTLAGFKWHVYHSRSISRAKSLARMSDDLPHLEREAEFVSSNRCRSCHPGEYHSWHRTFHRTMTQVAAPDNVVGQFDGSTVMSGGLPYRVYQKDDEFWAEMPDPEQMMYVVQGGKQIDLMTYWVKRTADSAPEQFDLRDVPRVHRRVVMTTGSHHYQTYWVGDEDRYGNLLQTLPLIYLIKDQRWIPREAAFMHPPESGRMITQWNHHCIRCHSTGGNPALSSTTGAFDTRVGELGIACEACHGPGEEHIRANQNPLRRYGLQLAGKPDHTIVNPRKLDHQASSQVCGQCHGVYITRKEYAMQYADHGILYRPGDDLHKTRYYVQYPREGEPQRSKDLRLNPTFFRERWWDDGTVLAGGREFTAMSTSGCYTRGEISCLSCHSMHNSDPVDQLSQDMHTNRACTQCHTEPRFNSRLGQHTFHAENSSGNNCMNCHMPHTTYALLGAIRNHGIETPRAENSIRHGVPNACNLCHLDKTLAWTQDHLSIWYGTEKVRLTEEQRTVSAALLWILKGDAAQRVITAWHVGWPPAQQASGNDWIAPFLAELLADPYGVVRYVTHESLTRLPGFETFDFDFLSPPNELRAQATAAQDRWLRGRPANLSRRGTHLLIDDGNNVMRKLVEDLLSERNNRPVTIKE